MRPGAALGALVACAWLCSGPLSAAPPGLTADQLIAKLLDARATSGYRIRAKITSSTTGVQAKQERQLLIKGRREGRMTEVLYQLLWPTDVAGHAVVIEDAGDHHVSGFAHRDGVVTPLAPARLSEPLFGTALSVEDVAEMYWYWPSRTVVGTETIDKRPCVIVELRPGPQAVTAYASIKAWIAPDVALPIRLQRFGHDGTLRSAITAERIVKQSGQWVAGRLIIVRADGGTRTVIEGSKYERDLTLPAADFTVDAVKNFGRPKG